MSKVKSRSELAADYGVHRSTIINWIDQNKQCRRELKALGWNRFAQIWKPSEIKVLQKYFD